MHANVGSLVKKKKKTKRNEGCEEIQKGGKYDSAEMIKMFKMFYGASSGRGTRIYRHTSLHYTSTQTHAYTQNIHAHPVHTLYFFKYKQKERATLLFELRVQQCKVLAIHTRSKNVI